MCTKLKIIDLSFHRQATISCLCNLKFPFCQLNNQLETFSQHRRIFRLSALSILSFFLRFFKQRHGALKQMGLQPTAQLSPPQTHAQRHAPAFYKQHFSPSLPPDMLYNVSAMDTGLWNRSYRKFTASMFTAVCFD